ncbi:hypothetical protein PSTG_00354 [Puccinia striiformis f. sp. tritici PST-78]|uniref:Uncharacterized protein n=1 Tax=Puccinia striiformis f. sp. tritici PST-78 TaxID=1165861 RepID=A0A0L0W4U0_9BASI|nr:hypothetical protein PSTG_00354 [Puccinia striiformis f. sp. tritici PST-78]
MPQQTERGSAIARMRHIIHQHVQGAMIGSALNDNSNDSSEGSDLEEALVALINHHDQETPVSGPKQLKRFNYFREPASCGQTL